LEQTISAESSSFLFLDNAGAEERSQRDAAELLQRELDHGCEVVPCPGCGQIQQHMFGLARWRRYRWMVVLGAILLGLATVVAIGAGINTLLDDTPRGYSNLVISLWIIVGVAGFAGLLLFVLWSHFASRHDPNAGSAEDRKRMGRDLAVSKQEFLKMINKGNRLA
jgi:hypothetical protein